MVEVLDKLSHIVLNRVHTSDSTEKEWGRNEFGNVTRIRFHRSKAKPRSLSSKSIGN